MGTAVQTTQQTADQRSAQSVWLGVAGQDGPHGGTVANQSDQQAEPVAIAGAARQVFTPARQILLLNGNPGEACQVRCIEARCEVLQQCVCVGVVELVVPGSDPATGGLRQAVYPGPQVGVLQPQQSIQQVGRRLGGCGVFIGP